VKHEYYLLLTTYYLLLTTYFLLPTTYFLLLVKHEYALVDVGQRKLAARDGDCELELGARRL